MSAKLVLALSFLTASLAYPAFAKDDHQHDHDHDHHKQETRQHNAHVHGKVEMFLAQDAKELLIEIIAPSNDVIGFEHAAQNEAQKAAIKQAIKTLNNANGLIEINKTADCRLTEIKIESALMTEHSDKHDSHDHDEHEHDKHNHDEHDHDKHDHDEHKQGGHSDFTAHYSFNCNNPQKLESIDFNWFNYFKSTQKITLNSLTKSGGKVTELTAKSNTFTF